MDRKESGEDALIARYFKPLATDAGAFGLLDDAAILKSSGEDVVVKTDAIVEGVHFLPSDPPDAVARKALRVNLSDLAAKGARPAGFVLTLALKSAEDAWLAPFARALGEDAAAYACPLLGGDTVSTPGPAMISIAAFGLIPAGRMIHRSGAKAGDRVMVTGTIGDAALGLDILKGGPAASALLGTVSVQVERYPGAAQFKKRVRYGRSLKKKRKGGTLGRAALSQTAFAVLRDSEASVLCHARDVPFNPVKCRLSTRSPQNRKIRP